MAVNYYRQLKVWQLGMELAKQAYLLTQGFPKHEVYGLSSQLQRAAVSIPANIAEGHARDSTKEYLRHVSIARGSLAEMETHLLVAESLDFCTQSQVAHLLSQCDEESRMLVALQRSLKTKLRGNP